MFSTFFRPVRASLGSGGRWLGGLLLGVSALSGQTLTLRALDGAVLAAGGGEVVITTNAFYGERPSAMGIVITLPDGWSMLAVQGRDRPDVAPKAGAIGELEFAYVDAPAGGAANFTLRLKYPAGSGPVRLRSDAHFRFGGEALAVEAEPLWLTVNR